VQFVGPLSIIDAGLAHNVESVVCAAVSNAACHANATALTITVTVEDEISIEVIDNGVGIPEDITGSGLDDLRRRAQETGGSFAIGRPAAGGTSLRWSGPTDLSTAPTKPTNPQVNPVIYQFWPQ
jgi:two-component system, NarL family, sensor histidine kinase DevS